MGQVQGGRDTGCCHGQQACQSPSDHTPGQDLAQQWTQTTTEQATTETQPWRPALADQVPLVHHTLTSCGVSSPGLDFLGLEGPPGLEKDLGDVAKGETGDLTFREGPPSRCPPPEKGTKGVGPGCSTCTSPGSELPMRLVPEVPASS